MSLTPAAQSVDYPGRKPFLNTNSARRKEVTLDAATVDSGNSPTTILRRGLVLAKTSGGDWIDAADATANENEAATVDSLEPPDSDWTGKILTFILNDEESFTVTLGTITDLNSAIADLNADLAFYANFIAEDDGSGNLRVKTRRKGADQYLSVAANLSTAYGGVAVTDRGSYGEFGVLEEPVDMLDISGAAAAKNGLVVTHNATVDENRLTSLTEGARVALAANGFKLENGG